MPAAAFRRSAMRLRSAVLLALLAVLPAAARAGSRGEELRRFAAETGSLDADAYRERQRRRLAPRPSEALGEVVDRIELPDGWQAVVHAEGLASPDGLALHPVTGTLFVAEEAAGRVCAVVESACEPVLAGLRSPEGIAFDLDGTLYVVEDVEGGRLLRLEPGAPEAGVLLEGLDAPEGVAVEADGSVVFTESNVQFVPAAQFRTRLSRLDPWSGAVEVLHTARLLWSYSGVAVHARGGLYVANEASGVGTRDGVFRIEPDTGERDLLASDLVAPEGLAFTAQGEFPLLVAEEDTGAGSGRLTRVAEDGTDTVFATGFFTIEDVAVDELGQVYVSEDATGLVLRLEPASSATAAARP